MATPSLAKGFIVNTVTGDRIAVMYNPEQFTLDQGNDFAEVGIPGLNAPPIQYVRGKGRTLAMDLFFDSYELGGDVRRFTDGITGLLATLPATFAPPVLLFVMGSFSFRCVLMEAQQRFTMFASDGTPVRSTISVRFHEYVDITITVESGVFIGPPTIRNIVQGDTASSLAAAVLGDPARWREIADANGIEDPFNLPAGAPLVIPREGGDMNQDFFAPRFDVNIAGITAASDITQRVLSVTYEGSLDVADMFKIVVSNPNNQFTDSPLFAPGQNVELYMGYGRKLTPMILGEITTIEPDFPASGPPTITISGYDKSYRMRHGQSVPRQFRYMTDSLIVAEIAAENLLIPICDPSPWFHTTLTQTGTDFGFIKSLATNNLFDAYVSWDKLYFQLPIQTKATVLEWGQSLRSFAPRLSTATMSGLQVVRGYNEELATAIIGVATGVLLNLEDIIERLGPATLDMLASLGRRWIHSQKITSPIDALALGKALLQQLLNGLYEGSGSCIGIPELRAGSYIEVAGAGKRFSGSYRLRKVRHTINESGYITDFDITQQGESSLLALIRKKTDLEVTPPRDRAEKFYGVYVGTVLEPPTLGSDPDPASVLGARVKVSFPWLSDLNESGWARVLTPQAGSGSGVYFMPNIGDTVLVAFQDGDISMPVVLGSVWDGPARPAVYPPPPGNPVQMIRTRLGHVITLDDTPLAPSVSITHANGSQVTMGADGNVTVKALKDLNLTATGNINLQATNVNVVVSGAVNIT